MSKIKILFVWPGLTGYMGACWRELANRASIDLKVVIDLSDKYFGGGFKQEDIPSGIDWYSDFSSLKAKCLTLDGWSPDIVFTVGWRNKQCRMAVDIFPYAKKVCCFDMPWEWRIRKIAARFVLQRYLRHFDAAFVNGESSRKYARWLGFSYENIFVGLIGTDTKRFEAHKGGDGFLFVGRNAPEKGLDVLLKAYDIYKRNGGMWDLQLISSVSPLEICRYYTSADCFVLPSRWEPWGVVLVEASAAGLPIICTDKCGARFEVVRDNGFVVKSGDAKALAVAMSRIANMSETERIQMGLAGKTLAKLYSSQAWADRVITICDKLMK